MPISFLMYVIGRWQRVVYREVIYKIDKKLIKNGLKCPKNGDFFLYLHPIIDINQ